MNVRIYQINMKRDTNHIAFMNYDSLPKFQGSSEIDSSLYDKVFEGEVNCFTLENLYEIFNLEHPAGYKGRSMSVSDVVEIIDGNNGKSYFHFCDSFGFQKVDFEPEKTQISDRFLLQKEGNSHQNPSVAKTDKSPLSERDSETTGTHTDKGVAKAADKKPSVREKLDRYKAAAKAEKEAERTVPEASKEKPKTPEANRQTVHRQPKKSKKPKER